ncbi:MAG: sodium:solute symporter [Opitutaceae bacterium]|nr:sodium:solute symporter [Opitutaceae bacterium]
MTSFAPLDLAIIAGYFLLTLVVGLWMTRRASQGLNHYFLGGRSMPWYLLGIAGMTNWFDLTGTMIITSFLYMLGPRGLFIEFRGGAVLVLAFMACYLGKWHRRSGCMTNAEWITYRFGKGQAARWMRVITALMWMVLTIGMLAYLVRGTSLFVGLFVPYPPMVVTAVLIAVCGLYTILSGFYGVVLTDLVQGLIIMGACLVISFMAFNLASDAPTFAALAANVTGNSQWTDSVPRWHTTMPRGYQVYEMLVGFAGLYLLRSILAGLGTGGESRYFGAKSDRDCGLLSILQGCTVAFRWPMMIGFAVLGLVLVNRLFPDKAVIEATAEAIHRHYPNAVASNWHDITTTLISRPDAAPVGVVAEVEQTLGEDWQRKLPLVGINGTINPEQVLPAVIANSVPVGVRGLILVAMLAAMMSTLTGWVNQAGAMMVRDIYQNLFRPGAANRELILCSYAASILLIVGGFWMGVKAGSINELWSWLMMGLQAGWIAPLALRLYWWRCNAWGVVGGTVLGGLGAVLTKAFVPGMLEWQQFFLMTTLSTIGTVAGSLLTVPTDRETLRHFYRTTRPFGWWKPLRDELAPEERAARSKEHRNDILAVPFFLLAQVTLFLLTMQAVIHAWSSFFATLLLFVVGAVGVWWFLWRNLPPADNPGTDRATMDSTNESSDDGATETTTVVSGSR